MSTYEQHDKLRLIRESERLNKREMSKLVGVPYSSLASYESGRMKMPLDVGIKIFKQLRFRKYQNWFLYDETDSESGQIAPALSLDGQDLVELARIKGKAI